MLLSSAGFLLGSVEALQGPGSQLSFSLFLWRRAPALRSSLVLVMMLVLLLVLRENNGVGEGLRRRREGFSLSLKGPLIGCPLTS